MHSFERLGLAAGGNGRERMKQRASYREHKIKIRR